MTNQSSIELMTIEETAKLLRISQRGVRRMLDNKVIPKIKIVGSVRTDKKDVLSYIESQRTGQSTDEDDDMANSYELIT